MRLKTRVMIVVCASLLGLLIMGFYGLLSMREAMMAERRAQIVQLLDFADSQLRYFHGLELAGKLTREQAQERAKEAIGAQKQGNDNRYFIRQLKDDRLVLYPVASLVGKAHDGGKMPDGRTVAQANRDAMAQSKDGKAFIELSTIKPSKQDQKVYPKINGLMKFEPWDWMPGIGFFVDDIEAHFWKQSTRFLLVAGGLFVLMAVLVFRIRTSILRQLGGEPQDAAAAMKKIANGDLSANIPLAQGDTGSLMASLSTMQMKLQNLTSAIQENSSSLSGQIMIFNESARDYKESRSDESMAELLRAVKKISKTVDILEKSIARFRV